MPETHISDWAQRERVAIDKAYATETREGGTRAIGADVPGVQREALSVFTQKEWERTKQRLTFEWWAKAARAAEFNKSGG
jgi:hypothetical protein